MDGSVCISLEAQVHVSLCQSKQLPFLHNIMTYQSRGSAAEEIQDRASIPKTIL
jgi:hypothetical protein